MWGAGDVPQCPAPTGDKGDNGGVQAEGKVGGAAPEEGAEDGAEVEEVVTARQEASEEALEGGDELAHQHVRHSLWEQDSLEAHNELLFGCLDDEVEALQQRKAHYDEARRLPEWGDPCWSYSGSDSGSEAGLEVGTEPLALEGAVEEWRSGWTGWQEEKRG